MYIRLLHVPELSSGPIRVANSIGSDEKATYSLFFSIRIYFIRISRPKFQNFKNTLGINLRLRFRKG